MVKYVLYSVHHLKLMFLLITVLFMLNLTVFAQNDLTQLIDFENDSDFDYCLYGNNDGIDKNKGYGLSKQSLKLSEANCLNPSWTKTYVQGSGTINFMRITDHDFASLFELVVFLDGNKIGSIECSSSINWVALDSPLRIHNLDSDFHELILEFKYKKSSPNNCNPSYPKSTLWIDDIKTTDSLIFVKNIGCPSIIKKDQIIDSKIVEALKSCNEIKIESGANLQFVLDAVESIQNQEVLSQKTLMLQGEYPGPIKIKNLKAIVLKNIGEYNVIFSGSNTSIELINSSGVTISGMNFGKSQDNALLMQDCFNCIIENNKIEYFSSSGIKMFNCKLNKIDSNTLQSDQDEVDGICLNNSSNNDVKKNLIYVDNYSYIFKNESHDNTIVHIDHGNEHTIKDNGLIFGAMGREFSKDGINEFDPNQESVNIWSII